MSTTDLDVMVSGYPEAELILREKLGRKPSDEFIARTIVFSYYLRVRSRGGRHMPRKRGGR